MITQVEGSDLQMPQHVKAGSTWHCHSLNGTLPLVHTPAVVDHTPVDPHVVLGLPTQPVLHVAVQTVPVVLLAAQLYTPLAGLRGLVAVTAHTACSNTAGKFSFERTRGHDSHSAVTLTDRHNRPVPKQRKPKVLVGLGLDCQQSSQHHTYSVRSCQWQRSK